MIEAATARQLTDLLLRVEERLTRLLTSGWRQARTEAADLQQEADTLTEAGLPELGARVAAVVAATDAASALQAVALAASACQLLRARVLLSEPREGWQPIRPPRARKSRAQSAGDTILPIARLQVAGQEVWACSWPARSHVVLLEPPLPGPPGAPGDPTDAGGLMARFQRQLARALNGEREGGPPSFWLRHRLRGSLRWAARYPLGAAGDIAACTLHDAEWQTDTDGVEQEQLRAFRSAVATNTLKDGTTLSWSVSGLRVVRLDQREWQSYTWIDRSAAEAFGQHPDPTPWALVWHADQVTMPLALLEPGAAGRKPRIVHLLPGGPTDVLGTPGRPKTNR